MLRDPGRVGRPQVRTMPLRERRERLEVRFEMVERGTGKIQVAPIVRRTSSHSATGQVPIGRIGEFLQRAGT